MTSLFVTTQPRPNAFTVDAGSDSIKPFAARRKPTNKGNSPDHHRGPVAMIELFKRASSSRQIPMATNRVSVGCRAASAASVAFHDPRQFTDGARETAIISDEQPVDVSVQTTDPVVERKSVGVASTRES